MTVNIQYHIMLIEYSVENFRSISEKTTFSMLASKGPSKPENLIKIEKNPNVKKLLKSCVIYGANASGKTNQIFALQVIRDFVVYSKNNNKGDKLPHTPFVLSKAFVEKPTRFEVDFISDNTEYIYKFSYDADQIITEELSYFKGKTEKFIFKREKDQLETFVDDDELSGLFRHTGDNVLFLSKANNEYKKFGPVFEWFNINLRTLGPIFGIGDKHTIDYINKSKDCKNKVLKILNYADFDISDISGNVIKIDKSGIPPGMLEYIEHVTKKPLDEGELLRTELKSVHIRDDGQEIVNDFSDFESDGTCIFFNILGIWLDALENHQRVLVIDEIDTRLHPDLIMYLLKMFHDTEFNKADSQLIFTTHNTRILSTDFFRRDQVWFTEKDKHTKTTNLFSLYDYENRTDRSIEKAYYTGRYGGLPDIVYGRI